MLWKREYGGLVSRQRDGLTDLLQYDGHAQRPDEISLSNEKNKKTKQIMIASSFLPCGAQSELHVRTSLTENIIIV